MKKLSGKNVFFFLGFKVEKNIHFLPNKYDYPKYFVKKPITRSASISENGGKIYRKKQKSKKTKKTKKQKKQKRTRKH